MNHLVIIDLRTRADSGFPNSIASLCGDAMFEEQYSNEINELGLGFTRYIDASDPQGVVPADLVERIDEVNKKLISVLVKLSIANADWRWSLVVIKGEHSNNEVTIANTKHLIAIEKFIESELIDSFKFKDRLINKIVLARQTEFNFFDENGYFEYSHEAIDDYTQEQLDSLDGHDFKFDVVPNTDYSNQDVDNKCVIDEFIEWSTVFINSLIDNEKYTDQTNKSAIKKLFVDEISKLKTISDLSVINNENYNSNKLKDILKINLSLRGIVYKNSWFYIVYNQNLTAINEYSFLLALNNLDENQTGVFTLAELDIINLAWVGEFKIKNVSVGTAVCDEVIEKIEKLKNNSIEELDLVTTSLFTLEKNNFYSENDTINWKQHVDGIDSRIKTIDCKIKSELEVGWDALNGNINQHLKSMPNFQKISNAPSNNEIHLHEFLEKELNFKEKTSGIDKKVSTFIFNKPNKKTMSIVVAVLMIFSLLPILLTQKLGVNTVIFLGFIAALHYLLTQFGWNKKNKKIQDELQKNNKLINTNISGFSKMYVEYINISFHDIIGNIVKNITEYNKSITEQGSEKSQKLADLIKPLINVSKTGNSGNNGDEATKTTIVIDGKTLTNKLEKLSLQAKLIKAN